MSQTTIPLSASLGRPSSAVTVLDAPATPATVSETYDTNRGRVASKTWGNVPNIVERVRVISKCNSKT